MSVDYTIVWEEPGPPLRPVTDKYQPGYVAPDSQRMHGTRAKYVVERCRCEDCRLAVREYERRRTRAIRRPDEVWVPYIEQATGAQKIPAGPTWALLDDLIARGYTKAWIAQQLGAKGPGLQIRRTNVRASTARKVEVLHRSLTGKQGPGRRSRWDER